MIIKIIGLIIGFLIMFAGIFYLVKEKSDPESKKVYSIVSIVGAIIVIVCILLILL